MMKIFSLIILIYGIGFSSEKDLYILFDNFIIDNNSTIVFETPKTITPLDNSQTIKSHIVFSNIDLNSLK